MPFQVHVPRPCTENWDAMQPHENGRHCNSCCKTVVDFTGWEPDAISNYLMARQGERICGRFDNTQLAIPAINEQEYVAAVRKYQGGFLQKFAAIALLVFGLLTGGCMGAPEQTATTIVGDTTIAASAHSIDTMNVGRTLGAPMMLPDSAKANDTPATPTMGMIAPVRDTAPLKPKKHRPGNKK